MMKSKLFRDRQEARASDFNDTQEFTRASLDALVADAITEDARYKGLSVSQASGTEVTVGQGRLYDQGRIYGRDVQTTRDLIADLPVASKRYITVVAYGQTVETSVEPRDFLIDLDAGTTEPQAVAMDEVRRVEIGFVSGSESVSPTQPTIAAGQVPVAHILLTPTGIESVEMSAERRLGGLREVTEDIQDLRAWRADARASVDGLRTTVAGLRETVAGKAPLRAISEIHENIAELRSAMQVPTGVASRGKESFDSRKGTATEGTFPDASFVIRGSALHFPAGGSQTLPLRLFNPADSAVKETARGRLLPAYDNQRVLSAGRPNSNMAMSSYTTTSTEYRNVRETRTVTRTGTRQGDLVQIDIRNKESPGNLYAVTTYGLEEIDYGAGQTRSEHGYYTILPDGSRGDTSYDSGSFGNTKQAVRDLATAIFQGDTDEFAGADQYEIVDAVYEQETYTYQEQIPTTRRVAEQNSETHTGLVIAQTVLSPRAMWLTQIGFGLVDLATSGDVTVFILGVRRGGFPDRDRKLTHTTIPYNDLHTMHDGGKIVADIDPVFIDAGERFAVVLVTPGSHKIATRTGGDVDLGGSVFYGTINDSGGWAETGDMQDKTLAIDVYGARFARNRTAVRLGDLTLANGVTDIEIATETMAPQGTEIEYQYQHNGQWRPLSDAAALVANRPSTVPLQAVFIGTKDVQPSINVGAGRVTAEASGGALTHYSQQRSLQVASDKLHVDLDVRFFSSAAESVNVELLDVNNNNDVISPTGFEDVEDSDVRRADRSDTGMSHIRRRWTFDPAAPLDLYRIKITGSTGAGSPRPFYITECVDTAA